MPLSAKGLIKSLSLRINLQNYCHMCIYLERMKDKKRSDSICDLKKSNKALSLFGHNIETILLLYNRKFHLNAPNCYRNTNSKSLIASKYTTF